MGFWSNLANRIRSFFRREPQEVKEKPKKKDLVEDRTFGGAIPEAKELIETVEPARPIEAVRVPTAPAKPKVKVRGIDEVTEERSKTERKAVEMKVIERPTQQEFTAKTVDDTRVNTVLHSGDLFGTYTKLFEGKLLRKHDPEIVNLLFENRERLKHRFSCEVLVNGTPTGSNKVMFLGSARVFQCLPENAEIFKQMTGNTYPSDALRQELIRLSEQISRNYQVPDGIKGGTVTEVKIIADFA